MSTCRNVCRLDVAVEPNYSPTVQDLSTFLHRIPQGYFQGTFRSARWAVTKTVHNNGRSVKIFAEELGGKEFVSCNFYQTTAGWSSKPCEMPLEKVQRFLREFSLQEF